VVLDMVWSPTAQELQACISALGAVAGAAPTSEASPTPSAGGWLAGPAVVDWRPTLLELAQLLEDSDMAAIEKHDALTRVVDSAQRAAHPEWDALDRAMDDLDFAAALQPVRALLSVLAH
jgi:hypothetical protein